MQRADMLALYDRQMRSEAAEPGNRFRFVRSGSIVRVVGPSPSAHDNCVVFSRLAPDSADAAILREIADFASLGHSFEWKLHEHDTPADLAERLLRHGFTPETPETVMIRDLRVEAPYRPPPAVTEIRRVVQPAQLSDLVVVQNDVWNKEHAWFGESLAGELAADPGQIEILIAYDGSRPVATSLLRLHRGTEFGSIWAAATLPAFRRRGLYTALAGRHASTARMAGARLLIADANADSRPVLEGVGFQPLVGVQGFIWHSPG